ncbi:hypothetical protein BDZ94DRAFT_1245278 [Collybia nuda]|uniref:Uncharacterized protein n=1 Tax=Collybia nuda TaxID=64659 RepID=A0A9P5YI46_9AGAR|nr:hypothetical protein BDZ94DRAFT_1245278 [Collybia nuda]
MTTLPSFVELMASLGLEASTKILDQMPSTRSSPSSSPRPAIITAPLYSRSKSTQSLRDASTTRQRVARYTPYSPVLSSARRGSLSSLSSTSSEIDRSPLRACSTSPRTTSSPRLSRRSLNKLSVNIYGSVSDLAANTPISTYVRRKTPGASPTSPTFPHEGRNYTRSESPMPVAVPTLPALLPSSENLETLPITPSDSESVPDEVDSRIYSERPSVDAPQGGNRSRRSHHAGTRISTPPRSELATHYPRRPSLAHVA